MDGQQLRDFLCFRDLEENCWRCCAGVVLILTLDADFDVGLDLDLDDYLYLF